MKKTSVSSLLEHQKKGLLSFFDAVDTDSIESCVDLLASIKGTLFVTGVGKSGYIAQKLTGSLVSIGIKAHFLSPMDALHGDMGIIESDDLVIMLSKSGESEELLNLVPFLRNKKVPVLAVLCKPSNRLFNASDYQVILPLTHELCPYDTIPTISAELQLIFSDLLAIALMHRHKISLESFAQNHPAGKIGRHLSIFVKDLMMQGDQLPLCSPSQTLDQVLKLFSEKRSGCLMVCDDHQNLIGLFTDGDLRRALEKHGSHVLQTPLIDLVVQKPKTILNSQRAVEALKLMEENQKKPITVLPVIDQQSRVVGLIRMHDILQAGIRL